MSVVDDIKERLDIIEVVGQYVPLKKAGHNYKGLCPFHSEKTPSFIVFPDTQTWHCFGACGIGGDVFSFIQRRENIEFPEALRLLAQRAGVTLQQRTPQEATADRTRNLLTEINEAAAAFFHHLLLNSAVAEAARGYLARRGIIDKGIAAFQLGYAPDEWHALETNLTAKGYDTRDLLAAGLLTEREDNRHYDRFRGRLIFPIRDIRGRVAGFGGRVLDDSLPKYLNSPQTPLFDKSSILYGIDLARDAIREQGEVVIVEGYMDVLMAHQHGIDNVVASMGTALTEKQLNVLKRLTKRIVLALDSDLAGNKGTMRGLETARKVLDRQVAPVPIAKGRVDYRSELDAEIRVITLPPDLDPDEIIRENPAEWQDLVGNSKSVMDYVFQALVADLDLDDPRGKAEAVQRLLPIIAETGTMAERKHYVAKLAQMARVDERDLDIEMRRLKRPQFVAPARKEGQFSAFPGMPFGMEQYCLYLLLEDARLFGMMNEVLDRAGLEPLSQDDFQQPPHRELFALLSARWERGEPFAISELDDADPTWGSLAQDFEAFIEYTASLPDADLALAARRCALQLRKLRLERRLVELRYLNEDAQRSQDGEGIRRWMGLVTRYSQEKRRLDEALSRVTVLGYNEKEGSPVH